MSDFPVAKCLMNMFTTSVLEWVIVDGFCLCTFAMRYRRHYYPRINTSFKPHKIAAMSMSDYCITEFCRNWSFVRLLQRRLVLNACIFGAYVWSWLQDTKK